MVSLQFKGQRGFVKRFIVTHSLYFLLLLRPERIKVVKESGFVNYLVSTPCEEVRNDGPGPLTMSFLSSRFSLDVSTERIDEDVDVLPEFDVLGVVVSFSISLPLFCRVRRSPVQLFHFETVKKS